MLYLAHLVQSHEGNNRGALVACGLFGNGGHSDEGGGGGIVVFRGADAEPCVAGPVSPEEPPDGPGPGGP